MADATARYPLLHRRRRRSRLRLPRIGNRVRLIAAMVLVLMLVLGGIVLAQRRAPVDPVRLLADARTTLAAGNYSAARSNAQAALAADPSLSAAQVVLARAYLELDDGLAAEAALARAVDTGAAPARLHALRAQARLLQGDAAGARAEAALAPPADRADAQRIAARALAVEGRPVEAQDALLAVLATDPNNVRGWTDLGRLRLTLGDVAGADVAAARAVAADARMPAALVLRGEIVRRRYGLVAALPWFAAARARDAFYYPALIAAAETLGDAGRNADMLAATRAALAVRPGDPRALYLQAVMAARAGQRDLARAMLDHGGDRAGVPGAVWLGALLDYQAGRYERANAGLRALVAAQPMNVAVRRMLAASLARSGDARAALDMLRPIMVRADADGYALRLAGRSAEMTGDRTAAARLIDRVAFGVNGAATPFATEDGIGALAAAKAGVPGDPAYAVGLIRGLVGAGDRAGALAQAQGLARATPGAAAAHLAVGDVLVAGGRYGEAAAAYARAADLSFDEPTMLRLVEALGRANRPADAATTLALYLSQNPQTLTARALLGHWQVAAGQWDAAIETLEGVRARIGNRDVALLVDLARAYAGDGDGAVARIYGAAAYALAPMTPAVVDAYGWAAHVDGDAAAARVLLDKARTLAPGDRAIAAHLAALRAAVGA
ncbi:hypothetical protein ASE75_08865 [Sphingomonas sp. Leaf17]|uniref:tetratricopeptide repeat protein n=1 Tax=Sphingomonas sp. Leaf17 TaxID=1735683 RepID=UPI0006F3B6F5|nr:tetratricopeptide repeat protein [Sphingomonas sp. Leaf17]KQM64115.1 hypothetical protein ASE75_08865 [Sphingomonas sp. Leaf17]